MRYKEITLDSCCSFCIKKICHRGWEIQKSPCILLRLEKERKDCEKISIFGWFSGFDI